MVFLAAGLLFAWGIWSVPLLSHNEARRLVVVREMLATHQWLTPMKNGVFYFEKPPFFYWVGVFFSTLFGSSAEWVMRLPSTLAALFTTGFLYRRVRFYIGRQQALFSVLILVSSPCYVNYARRAEINMLFGTLCFVALLLYFDYLQRGKQKYLYLSFLVLGLAVLTKGPVALIFFLTPMLVYGALQRERKVFRGLLNLRAWVLFALVGGTWFGYALYGIPDSPLHAVIQRDIVAKVYENIAPDPFYSYFAPLLGAFAPWIPALFYRPKNWLPRLTTAPEWFFLCAFGVPLLVMSCFAVKHGKYMLPIFPFLAAFIGCAVSAAYDDFGRRWGRRFHVWFLGLTGGMLAILFGVLVLAQPYLLPYRFAALKPFASKIRSLQGPNPVFSYRSEQIRLIYYYGGFIPVLNKAQLAARLDQQQSFLLVAEGVDRPVLDAAGLCLIEEFMPYLKKGCKGLLYGSGEFCRMPVEASQHPGLSVPSPDLVGVPARAQ